MPLSIASVLRGDASVMSVFVDDQDDKHDGTPSRRCPHHQNAAPPLCQGPRASFCKALPAMRASKNKSREPATTQ